MKIHSFTLQARRLQSSWTLRKGITLVEILVVIVIIVLLAGITIPITQRMRAKGQSATCLSNVRQVGSGILMYAYDHSGRLPSLQGNNSDGTPGDLWCIILAKQSYLGDWQEGNKLPCGTGVWTCPSSRFVSDAYGGYGVSEGDMFNYPGDDGSSSPKSLLSSIERPEKTWLVGDTHISSQDPEHGWYGVWENPSGWGGHGPAARHGEKVHVCMVDGHVEALSVSQLREGKYTYAVK